MRLQTPTRWWRKFLVLACLGLVASASAQTELTRPAGGTGTVIVPDRFLRRWDPVTLFFAQDVGPTTPGPEDQPDRFVKLNPAHPGAYRWIDARTLQFRPVDPWPSLGRFVWSTTDSNFTLSTLMESPLETLPAAAATGLDPVQAITLKFTDPLDDKALLRMVSIELQPLPGIAHDQGRWLRGDDFSIKVLERTSRTEPASYVLALRNPIPLGTRATVHLRLSLDDADAQSTTEFSFSTAEPFRILSMGCAEARVPVTPEGSRYGADQALNCGSETRTLSVELSANPKDLGTLEARNLVRFTPAVPELSFSNQGKVLQITGQFAWDTAYQMTLSPTNLQDGHGRLLQMTGSSEVHVYFPRKPSYLKWGAGQGIVERFGPQLVPLEGRGDERVDLRLHKIDALDRSFWPFPSPIMVSDVQRPPSPGEEPTPVTAESEINDWEVESTLQQQIWRLSTTSPAASKMVELPLRKEGSSATFGLDIKDTLQYFAGTGQPGTYLLGLRRLDSSQDRSWMRIQVTDLSLSTVEEPKAVVFVVTSLSTGLPVSGAQVRVETGEGYYYNRDWKSQFEGTTDAQGRLRWELGEDTSDRTMRRFVVQKDNDTLILDPSKSPDYYADNQWFTSDNTWLQWTQENKEYRGASASDLAHIFTERPVYRPEEVVHIKGYTRHREEGQLTINAPAETLVVEGPGDVSWRYPVTITEHGSFYHQFTNEDLPTGAYRAYLEDENETRYGSVTWLMEAYRIPEFELRLQAPDWASLDQKFEVSTTATYYAGGRVAERPVQWRVTQFPYTWTPKKLDGFLYSSDQRYSQNERFRSTPALELEDVTDQDGIAKLSLDPTIEATAQPRSYVIEATVTGADDQTVTATRRVLALPPFALGLKVPRYLDQAQEIKPELILAGPDGKLIPGKEVTVRLLHRQWHSYLRVSDFSDGVARYITEVVDQKVFETKVQSGAEPIAVPIPIDKAGVYIVELEAHDRLNRAQTVSVDLYAGGSQPVTWQKPASGVFSIAADQAAYNPGQTAALVLRSPFQTAEALVIIEAPDGNRYEWLHVEGGQATYQLPIDKTYVPRVPVHVILMRGRVPDSGPIPGNKTDLGKPATMSATEWVSVNPVSNQVQVGLKYPEKSKPGETVSVEIELKDEQANPLPGEVTLWLVDAAVLALGKEQRLDPLPDFITQVQSYLRVLDTRSFPFGFLPFAENPGGDEGEEPSLLDQSTVRRTFKPVPYYNPAIEVGPDGRAVVTVQLPDNLTNFKLRAKAVSGADRFGFAVGQMAIRLPVIVQPALPRFVRPGDRFKATAIGRVVEGEGGAGAAEVRVQGLTLEGPTTRPVELVPNRPERLEFQVQVQDPTFLSDGTMASREIQFMMGLERQSDKARDAFDVKLPIRDDRQRVEIQEILDLTAGKAVTWAGVPEPVRPGTLQRSILVSDQAALLRMSAGLNFLLEYPHGCTEQKISRARAYMAMNKFRDVLQLSGDEKAMKRVVQEVLDGIPDVVSPNGLCSYWPGSQGYVSLTAWVVQFLVEARNAGFTVDAKLMQNLTRALEQSLRSDYANFIDGESYMERVWALSALASAGKFDAAYAAELARKAQVLDLEGLAEVLLAMQQSPQKSNAATQELVAAMLKGVVVRLFQGREVYGGLQEGRASRNGLILPSETRTVATVVRAMTRTAAQNPKLQLLVDALVQLGRGNGWGSTNANAAALMALSDVLQPPLTGTTARTVMMKLDGKDEPLTIGPQAPVLYRQSLSTAPAELTLQPGPGKRPVVARVQTSYVPAADGSQVEAKAQGFVVTRELQKVQPDGAPPERIALEAAGKTVKLEIGDVIEEHVQIVNPEDRNYVAIVVPLAAGVEPMNPNLATASADAKPAGQLTLEPSYVAFLDHQAAFYYDTLPKGTYDFYFRTRATTEGTFLQPAALAEKMYDASVRGNSVGAKLEVQRGAEN